MSACADAEKIIAQETHICQSIDSPRSYYFGTFSALKVNMQAINITALLVTLIFEVYARCKGKFISNSVECNFGDRWRLYMEFSKTMFD
jgi:hypothetical protein